jgi:hypothetical protein
MTKLEETLDSGFFSNRCGQFVKGGGAMVFYGGNNGLKSGFLVFHMRFLIEINIDRTFRDSCFYISLDFSH